MTKKKKNIRDFDPTHDFRIARYSALYNAWVSTNLEVDKQILTLCSGAIALLIGLLSSVVIRNTHVYWVFGLTLFTLVVVIFCVLVSFVKNGDITKAGAMEQDTTVLDVELTLLDKFIRYGFAAAVILVCMCGAVLVIEKNSVPVSNGSKTAGQTECNNPKVIHLEFNS